MTAPFSDYIVFVDESGDHSMENINKDFPLFCLAFCIFSKVDYVDRVTPPLRWLKTQTFGHDMVVLHEHDIRKKAGPFARLSRKPREAFMDELTRIMEAAPFVLIAVVIDKLRYKERYAEPLHPYHLAMQYGIERLHWFLRDQGQADRTAHVVFEGRGKNEDAMLELEFRRIAAGENCFGILLPFEFVAVDKKANSEGLQLADLVARPVALSVLRPDQPNRTRDVLERKYYRDKGGRKEGFGLKVFP